MDRSPELKAKEDASEQVADEVIATAIANNEPKKKKKKKRVRKTRKVQPSVVPNITTADEAAEILEPSLRNFSTIHDIDSIQSDTDKGSREDAGVPVAGEIPMTSSTVIGTLGDESQTDTEMQTVEEDDQVMKIVSTSREEDELEPAATIFEELSDTNAVIEAGGDISEVSLGDEIGTPETSSAERILSDDDIVLVDEHTETLVLEDAAEVIAMKDISSSEDDNHNLVLRDAAEVLQEEHDMNVQKESEKDMSIDENTDIKDSDNQQRDAVDNTISTSSIDSRLEINFVK